MRTVSRRDFIKGSLMYAGGAAIASKLSPAAWANVRGANDDIRVAVVGFNGVGN